MKGTMKVVPMDGEHNEFLVMAMAIRGMQREGKCRVHWGAHSCNEQRRHTGEHLCACKREPLGHSVLWGEDITTAEKVDMRSRAKVLGHVEHIMELQLK